MPIVQVPKLGSVGVIYDQPPEELPVSAFSDVRNVRFREGAMEKILGHKQIYTTPSVTPYWLQSYNQGGKRWWIHAGTAQVFADDGNSRVDITPTSAPTGAATDRYTGGVLNGVLLMNNGVDAPWYWGGTGVLQTLTGWQTGYRARSIRPYKNVAVALGITKGVGTSPVQYPHMVKWSDLAVPGAVPASWDQNDPTKNAGELDLAEEPSEMVDQLTLGDANIIYKQQSMWSMVPSGDNSVFRFQRLPGDVGALARGCIANTPLGHVVLTPGDVILHAGQGPKSIINARLRRWLFSQIDSTNGDMAFVTTNPATNEVLVCFPSLGASACDRACVWNWVEDTWSVRDLPNVTYGATGQIEYSATQTWDSDNDAWDDDVTAWDENEFSRNQSRLLVCTTGPLIAAMDSAATFNGTPFTGVAERTGWTMDEPDRVKVILGVRLRVTAPAGTQIQVQVGSAMQSEDAVTWSAPALYTHLSGKVEVNVQSKAGRFMGVRFTTVGNQVPKIVSYGVNYKLLGGY